MYVYMHIVCVHIYSCIFTYEICKYIYVCIHACVYVRRACACVITALPLSFFLSLSLSRSLAVSRSRENPRIARARGCEGAASDLVCVCAYLAWRQREREVQRPAAAQPLAAQHICAQMAGRRFTAPRTQMPIAPPPRSCAARARESRSARLSAMHAESPTNYSWSQ